MSSGPLPCLKSGLAPVDGMFSYQGRVNLHIHHAAVRPFACLNRAAEASGHLLFVSEGLVFLLENLKLPYLCLKLCVVFALMMSMPLMNVGSSSGLR